MKTMKLPFTIDVVVPRIIDIGFLRIPNEACGLIIPNLDVPAYEWVHELQNRSPDPTNSYIFDTQAVQPLLTDKDYWDDVLIWHTHPSGRVGPSPHDMQSRHPALHGRYLVVTLPRGEATLF